MAIVQNFWLQGASKRLAGAVLYEAMGQTRARQLATSVTNPRTEAQMTQRIKWANLVNFYRANSTWMKYAFESKKSTQSEYNKFMSLNVSSSRIALTKQAAASGACVVTAYTMTQGSLPSVEWSDANQAKNSNVYLGNLTVIDAGTTVGAFSEALIGANAALREGDQISFIRFTQMTNAATGYPYVIVRKYEVLLKTNSLLPLDNYLPVEFFSVAEVEGEYILQVPTTGRQGGFCMIISRTIGGKTYVSSQNIVVVNNEATITAYSSSAAIQAAIDSYGESSEAFLSSVSASAASNNPLALTILSATLSNTPYTPGQKTPLASDLAGQIGAVYFNFDTGFDSDDVEVGVDFTDGDSDSLSVDEVADNYVSFNIPANWSQRTGVHIYQITIETPEQSYVIRFASANSYTIGGLE